MAALFDTPSGCDGGTGPGPVNTATQICLMTNRRPQDGVSSTDRDRWLRTLLDLDLLVGMNLFKRIVQRAKGIRSNIELGMTTAEYAVGTVAAVAFATVGKPTR